MDEREALKFIGDWVADETCKRKYKNEEVRNLSLALKKLKECAEKQIPKKPIIFDCCECGNTVSDRLGNGNFPLELGHCLYCGQKQDWSEE